jgi:hypothetical protein
MTNSVNGVLNSQLEGFSFNDDFALDGTGFCQGQLRGQLAGHITGPIRGNIAVALQPGGYYLEGLAHQGEIVVYGFNGTYSGYSLRALGGAQTPGLQLSGYSFSATGTTTILGEFTGKLSGYSLSATGTATALGHGALVYSGYSLSALGGANAALVYNGTYKLTAHGYAGNTGEFNGVYSGYSMSATGTQRNFAVVRGILRGLTVQNSGRFQRTAPRFTLVATGHNLESTPVYEGYAVTFASGRQGPEYATTRYATFPFERIVRFGGTYYGVATDGLFALGGDDFDGDPIISVVASAETDFGDRHQKRPVSIYLSGRMGADVDVSVTSAEVETDTYPDRAVASGSRNHRARFGKGIKARYLAYGFTNTDGDDWELDELTPELEILRRTA